MAELVIATIASVAGAAFAWAFLVARGLQVLGSKA